MYKLHLRVIFVGITILQYNVRTMVLTKFIASNICLAADAPSSSSDYQTSSNMTYDSNGRIRSSKAVRTKLTLHNDTETVTELFHVKSCPSRCQPEAVQDDENQYTKLRKTMSDSNHPKKIRIFYLILIHNQRSANDALFLFRAIRDPRNIIILHFDKKAEYLLQPVGRGTLALLEEIESCSCGSKVQVESVHSVEWSKWSMNLPTLWGMELASSPQYINEWDIFINLSGDTIPVYTPSTMAIKLNDLSSYNFVTSRSCETGLLPTNVYTFPKNWHKRRHYTRDDTEPDPIFTYRNANNEIRNKTIVTHFGSQWIMLQNSFVTWLVNQLQDKNSWPSQFRAYLTRSEKLMTDETFIPSILMHVNEKNDGIRPLLPRIQKSDGRLVYPNGTLSNIFHVRYERMDEHYPTSYGKFPSMQHYQVPESFIQQSILDQPKIWGPYFLGTYDLGDIRNTGAFFARKVSALLDRNMIELLPVDRSEEIPFLHWPIEISITKRPDWTVEKQMWEEMHANTMSDKSQPATKQEEESSFTTSRSDGYTDDDEEL